MRLALALAFVLLVGEHSLTAQAQLPNGALGELVFVNEMENQTSVDYYTAFTIWFDGMADPIRIDPRGRFVLVTLPSGDYHVTNIQLYLPAAARAVNGVPVRPFSVTVKPGAQSIFPYALVTRLLKGSAPGSFRPFMQPRALAGSELEAVEKELAQAASAGTLGPARSLSEVSQARPLIPQDTSGAGSPAPSGPPGDLVFVNDVNDPNHRGFSMAFLVYLEGRDDPLKVDQSQRFVRVSLPSGVWRVTHIGYYNPRTNERSSWADEIAPFTVNVPPDGQVLFPYRFVSQNIGTAASFRPDYHPMPYTAAEVSAVQTELGKALANAAGAPAESTADQLTTSLGIQMVSGPMPPDAGADETGGSSPAGSSAGEVVFVNDVQKTWDGDFSTAWLIYIDGRPRPLKIDPTSRFVRLRLPPGDYQVSKVGLYTVDTNDLAKVMQEVKPLTLSVKAGQQLIFPWQLVTRLLAGPGTSWQAIYEVHLMPPSAASAAQADLQQTLQADPHAVPGRSADQLTPSLGAMTASVVAQLPADLVRDGTSPTNGSGSAAGSQPTPPPTAAPGGPPGELVFVNDLAHPPGLDFYTAYLVFLTGLEDPVRVDPDGKFVRVSLPSGAWQVTGVALYRPGDGSVVGYMREVAPFTLTVPSGQRTLFPYRLVTRLEGTPQSYGPVMQALPLAAADTASLMAELDQAAATGTGLAPAVRPLADLAQKLVAPKTRSDAVLAQDSKPFLQFASEQGIARPERYAGDSGEFFFPRLTAVDPGARTVSLGGYLPRSGNVSIDWGDGQYSGATNGGYQAASLVHRYTSSASVFRIGVRWQPLKTSDLSAVLFPDLSARPWLPNADRAIRAVVGRDTGLSITDGLVQVVNPDIDGAILHITVAGAPAFKFVKDLFGDGFQFVLIFPLHQVGDMPPGLSNAVSQPAFGLGFGPFKSGTAGTIQEISRMSLYTTLASSWPLLEHEMFHNYGNGIIPTADGAHWGYSSVNGLIGGFDPATLVSLGNNQWKAASFRTNHNPPNLYGDLELYLMGLAPPAEVKPIQYFESAEIVSSDNTSTIFQSKAAPKTVTIQELIAAHGPRLPAWPNSPHTFRAIAILLTDVELSPIEIEPYLESIHWLTLGQSLTLAYDMHNFQAMTKGRGFLSMEGLLKAFRTNQ